MRFITLPIWAKSIFKNIGLCEKPQAQPTVYLTFDDGPIPEVTPWVLDILAQYQVKATFFCIGENIHKHPNIFQQIQQQGHQIGNHTYNHLNGWQTSCNTYIANTEKCNPYISSTLFRPPYGKITPLQARKLKEKGYQIVLWSILTYDFDVTLNPENAYPKICKGIKNGSIIVFHDSIKAQSNLQYLLPRLLTDLQQQNYVFKTL